MWIPRKTWIMQMISLTRKEQKNWKQEEDVELNFLAKRQLHQDEKMIGRADIKVATALGRIFFGEIP